MAYTTIDKPTDYFNTKLYTGTGSSQSITGVGFQTDWTWIKDRDSTENHNIFDTVRTATKRISSNRNNAEDTQAQQLTAFGSDGFTVGTDSGANHSGRNYVSWNWLAGGSASSNSNGSITSSVSANTTAGFSIVSYTGNGTADATIGHGLSDTIAMIILKNRDDADNWWVYHKGLSNPSTKAILLNSTNAEFTPGTSAFNPSGFSTSVFSVKNDNASNSSGDDYIAYCFAGKQGYSKFGSYTGNGNADGTFVHTGFKPAWTLIKRTDSSTGGSWILFDNKRGNNVRNPVDVVMAASNNQSESDWGTTYDCDYLSNGFKWRYDGTGGYNNTSSGTYIYMAFAESPFVTGATGIPTTAR